MENKRYDIYKCGGCGTVAEIVEGHNCVLNCGNQPMKLLNVGNHTGDAIVHVPIITHIPDGYFVRVSTEPHPMIPTHYIEFIELTADGKRYKTYLSPGDQPQAEFTVPLSSAVSSRIYCNLHGVWTSDGKD
ncbi:MAG: hypothetical protein LBT20_04475 [Clostridiales bacterium]|jgi:superoxide reductase|nr:hypothetical protein [Clostridiales bacterium]